ncbi:ArsR/SmtB family transcription factor [Haloglomus salinum]|uniref:ArsR/SmtB family transcription factor n=1 Tax=Haloglomus salinum TaxID=2962673 RepID=UPI0020C9CE4F|nr:helix-turn-helix domain-containing protein [Haloglomus salinum]
MRDGYELLEKHGTRWEVFRTVRDQDNVTCREVAEEVDSHKTTVSSHLNELHENDLVDFTKASNNTKRWRLSDEAAAHLETQPATDGGYTVQEYTRQQAPLLGLLGLLAVLSGLLAVVNAARGLPVQSPLTFFFIAVTGIAVTGLVGVQTIYKS